MLTKVKKPLHTSVSFKISPPYKIKVLTSIIEVSTLKLDIVIIFYASIDLLDSIIFFKFANPTKLSTIDGTTNNI